jgi:hypothetical protein
MIAEQGNRPHAKKEGKYARLLRRLRQLAANEDVSVEELQRMLATV